MPDVLAFADKLPGFKPPTFLMFIFFVKNQSYFVSGFST